MKHQKIHIINEEMNQQLLEMVFSKNGDDIKLAEEIILNSNIDDLNTFYYVENIGMILNYLHPKPLIVNFYLGLKKHPNWELYIQEVNSFLGDENFTS